MRIRIKRNFSYEDRSYQAGTVANVSQEKGERWCSHGLAMQDKSMDVPKVKTEPEITPKVVKPKVKRKKKK